MKLRTLALIATTVMMMGAYSECEAGEDTRPAPAAQAPAPKADPPPVNAPRSPKDKDKQIRIRFRAVIERPVRPSTVSIQVGQRLVVNREAFGGKAYTYDTRVSPNTYVSMVVYNGLVGGEVMPGRLSCAIYIMNADKTIKRRVARNDNRGPDERLPAACDYVVQSDD